MWFLSWKCTKMRLQRASHWSSFQHSPYLLAGSKFPGRWNCIPLCKSLATDLIQLSSLLQSAWCCVLCSGRRWGTEGSGSCVGWKPRPSQDRDGVVWWAATPRFRHQWHRELRLHTGDLQVKPQWGQLVKDLVRFVTIGHSSVLDAIMCVITQHGCCIIATFVACCFNQWYHGDSKWVNIVCSYIILCIFSLP